MRSTIFKLFLMGGCIISSVQAKEPQEVLSFWFGEGEYDPARNRLWFGGDDPAFDQHIKDQFEEDVLAAASGDLDHWKQSPKTRLALIILLDQFPRNMYRGSNQAYAFDALAVQLTLEGIALGEDKMLSPAERVFFYLPLEHSENLEHQNLSVEKFSEIAACDSRFERHLSYAIEHRKDIVEFGYFVRF